MIMPAYNCADVIDAQLQALAAQDYAHSFSVVVSDNGSTDGLRAHVQNHRLASELNLTYVDASGSSGASYARNRGAESAAGEYLAFCDADDAVHPSWLSRLVEALESADLVGTALEIDTLNSDRTRPAIPFAAAEHQGKNPFRPFVIGASMACRASMYRVLGGMREDVRASEDLEFSWRAQGEGFRLAFVAEPLVAYRLRTGLRSHFKQAAALGYGSAHVCGLYRAHGCPPFRIRHSMLALLTMTVRNPLVPDVMGGIPADLWTREVAGQLAVLRGGIRHRSLRW
ncbi:glycosyltransferase [Rhodococcoides yunnanense]|uniref:Glycosyltransferase family A protein n=1 Tax=Rhodococcoides yunnanense TaxID=278209 RepID=A0ABU4BGS4_9NOCA|nr:glycosyltransferase family A protein [Rhodococcus yunnanensis]MDV6263413.1 glycosyltransferase family A protein [Rhodococcus yunnanensis]